MLWSYLIFSLVALNLVAEGSRTTDSGHTYEFVGGCYTDRRSRKVGKCYRERYFNGRRHRNRKPGSDKTNLVDLCSDRLRRDRYCFAIQNDGICYTDEDCTRFTKSFPCNQYNPKCFRRVYGDPSIADKVGGRNTNAYYNSFTCGWMPKDSNAVSKRVAKGQDAPAYPWVGYAVCGTTFCTGTLISFKWFITAAHCVDRLGEKCTIYLGSNKKSDMTQMNAYVESFFPNNEDVALLKITTDFQLSDRIRPICLDTDPSHFSYGTVCMYAGWGLNENGKLPDALQEISYPIYSYKKCEHISKWIKPSMMCYGLHDGTEGPSSGDSGGPMMCQKDNIWYLTAVHRGGGIRIDSNGLAYEYATRISDPFVRKWINDHTGL